MLEYLIKVTANTFSISVPAALLWALLRRPGEPEFPAARRWGKYPLRGFLAGLALALVYAVLKRNTGFMVREYYDLAALVLSIAAEAALLFTAAWALFAGKTGVHPLLASCAFLGWTAYCAPNLFLYPFDFAVGMDNIFNTEFFFKAAGYLAGLLLVFLTGLSLRAAMSGARARGAAAALGAATAGLLARDSLAMAQILLGRNLIPRYTWLTRLVIEALSRENAFPFFFTGLAALLAAVLLFLKATPPGESAADAKNPAQARKAKFLARRRFRFRVSVLLGVTLSLLTVTVGAAIDAQKAELSPPTELPAADGRIVIPLEKVNDGDLHRFVYRFDEEGSTTAIRYIVIRKNETAYGVGLDACDVCGASGYFQRGKQVVCILCDVVMNISTIGLPGGCNPVPLAFSVESGALVIRTDDLEAEAYRFY
jgi:uncharacterized membrane protein